QVPKGLPVSHRTRSARHLLAMSPDPKWLAELGNPYERIGSDLSGRVGIEWGLSGVPETFIVGSDGTVLFRYVGPVVGETAISTFREALIQAGALARGQNG
ncbi:hypothetical protein PXK00_18185, partial [Phaeobacter sp. QD34_3]|nr:hypothetical protein [Phaeobacter sp. QD34_3]MDE4138673.1 hypothetical protein [Phaeobacter sp. QD34_24]